LVLSYVRRTPLSSTDPLATILIEPSTLRHLLFAATQALYADGTLVQPLFLRVHA
jgi:hypothetical protein